MSNSSAEVFGSLITHCSHLSVARVVKVEFEVSLIFRAHESLFEKHATSICGQCSVPKRASPIEHSWRCVERVTVFPPQFAHLSARVNLKLVQEGKYLLVQALLHK